MQGSGGGQKDSSEMEMIWLAIGILGLVAFIVGLFHTQILTAILWIKYGELKLLSFFMVNQQYQGIESWINPNNHNRVSLAELSLLSLEIGNTLKGPCAILCVIFIGIGYVKHPASGFRDIENMKSLAEKVRQVFPAINVMTGLNLVKTPIDEGPWAMALTPIEFGKKHGLLHRNPKTKRVMVDEFKAKLIFSQQLGPLWKGIEALKPHEKALFAIFAAFINYKRDEAEAAMEEIMEQITQAQINKKSIPFRTQALLKKYGQTPPVLEVIKKHAYVSTIFMEMLVHARGSGIVLNSLVLWVKPIDRPLWYILNNVGRKAVFIEAAGVHAHGLAERRLGFEIRQPMVDEAIFALQEAIDARIIKDL
jgi:intracellular multiplication protein IcmP